jgi:hypothetical protein
VLSQLPHLIHLLKETIQQARRHVVDLYASYLASLMLVCCIHPAVKLKQYYDIFIIMKN